MDILDTKKAPIPIPTPTPTILPYDRMKELKAFDETKAGVKGLVDAGVVNIPRIFIQPPDELVEKPNHEKTHSQLPIIDLNGMERADRRKEIVDELRDASEKWGFFQVVNHGIPLNLLDNTCQRVRDFHELDAEVKKEYYSRDRAKRVIFSTSNDLFMSRSAAWRDSLTISLRLSDHLAPNELPAICRETTLEYIHNARKLGNTLFGLLSEALGLKLGHLEAMECAKGCTFVCHYYPPCPQPELTLGATKHADASFLTVLLQDDIAGLQVFHKNQWIDVPPIRGGFVVNIGDFLQIVSNDKFKSVQHRVLANCAGPRISVACFFNGCLTKPEKLYGPIEELTSEENPPLYGEFQLSQYIASVKSKGLQESVLEYFKL